MAESGEEKFAVVIFEDNSVQVIPSVWLLDNSTCVYPNFSNDKKIRKAVQTKQVPDDDWKSYNITIFGTYDSLKMADEKSEKAMTSAEDTLMDIEPEKTNKRKRTKRSYGPEYDMDDDEDEDGKTVATGCDLVPDPEIVEEESIDIKPNIFVKALFEEEESFMNDLNDPPVFIPKESSAPRKLRKVYRRKSRRIDNEVNGQNINSNSQRDVCCKCADLVRSLSSQMVKMQQDMNTLVGLLDTMPKNGSNYYDLISQKRDYHDIEYLFPVKSLKELEEVENIIATDAVKRAKIENFVKSFGGKEYDLPVSDILYHVFSNRVAVLFCYEGRNKAKLAAAALGIIQIIRDAILDTCKNSTRNAIKAKMMQWFKDAKKRLSLSEGNKSYNEVNENSVDN